MNGSFGNWLKQRRKALDLTQADLAHQVVCSVATIRKIEADDLRPSKQTSERMADVLAISLEERPTFLAFARRTAKPLATQLLEQAAPNNLPIQSTPFIGRETELALIHERLTDPACRLLTFVGAGGIGKTRLALQAASQHVGVFADGVYFVSLTPVGTTMLIASAIAGALQLAFYGQGDPNTQLIHYLQDKKLLLVLDNYEHLLDCIDALSQLLNQIPHVKLLVTSRERLNLQEEWVLPVEGLPYPTHAVDSACESYSAVQLFVQTARRLQPQFTLDGNQAGVVEICQAVEGMPLGIELAATWLRVMPCDQIAAQIRCDLDFLATPLRNVEPRHRSVRAVFEHSWGLLTDTERSVIMKLSVFRGGFDAEAAATVAGASLLMLASLLDKSLIRLNVVGRYELQELLRQFVADKLVEAEKMEAAQRCHFHFFLEMAEKLEGRLYGPEQLRLMDRLELEHDNLRAALSWAVQMDENESGLRLAGALGWFWKTRTHWLEGRNWLRRLMEVNPNAPLPLQAKAMSHILELSHTLNDDLFAVSLCEPAVALARAVDKVDQRWAAWLFIALGRVGELVNGLCHTLHRGYLEEALQLARCANDPYALGMALSMLAAEAQQRGDLERAGELQAEGLVLVREAGDRGMLAGLLNFSGCRRWYRGQIDTQTESQYQEALILYQELRDHNGMVWSLSFLGKIAHVQGDDQRARAFFAKGLTLSQHMGNQWVAGLCLIGLADIEFDQSEMEQAVRLLGAINVLVETLYTGDSLGEAEPRQTSRRILDDARAKLDEASFAAAFAAGQRMSLDEAVTYALSKD